MIALGIPNGFEWLILLVIVLLLFGNRLPTMARSLGSGITEFKRGLKEGADKGAGDGRGAGDGGNKPPSSPGGGSGTPPS